MSFTFRVGKLLRAEMTAVEDGRWSRCTGNRTTSKKLEAFALRAETKQRQTA